MSDTENSSAAQTQEAGGSEDAQNQGQNTNATGADQADKDWENSQGSGGKAAVLADLNKERTQRQQLAKENQELKTFKEGLAKLLGGEQQDLDPKELANKLTSAESRASTAEKLLGVYRSAPVGADVAGLVDSVAFRAGLAGAEDVAEFTKKFIKDNPRFAGTSADTARNLNQGNGAGSGGAKTMNDILRSAR